MTTSDTFSQNGDAEMRAWCCGMPLAEERGLTADEAAALRQEAAKLQRQGATAIASVFMGFFLLSALSRRLSQGPHMTAVEISLEFIAALAIAGWLLLSGESPLWRAQKLLRDVRQGVVKVFQGVVADKDVFDTTQATLIKLHALSPTAERPQTVLVLPEARRVWSVNGRQVAQWVSARWAEIAPPPPFAAVAAQWLVPTGRADAGEVVSTGQRELSHAEQMEIRRSIRRHWRRPLPAAVILTAWLLWPTASALWTGGAVHLSDWSSGILTHIWAIGADLMMAYGILQAYKLSRDLREGSVRIMKLTPQERPTRSKEGREAVPSGGPKSVPIDTLVEYLPVSLRLWTENGAPASWRRTQG